MLRELRGLARETAVYGLSTVLGRMLSFLLTPLYSHLLEPTDNGAMRLDGNSDHVGNDAVEHMLDV